MLFLADDTCLVLSSFRFPAVMQANLSRQKLVLHCLSSCLVPVLPFCELKFQETSDPPDLFLSTPLLVSSLVMTLRY